jgi:hypothetical protein
MLAVLANPVALILASVEACNLDACFFFFFFVQATLVCARLQIHMCSIPGANPMDVDLALGTRLLVAITNLADEKFLFCVHDIQE